MTQKKYDVIIIGAGIGGLFCGCYLARSGSRVLILEAHAIPGGCVTSLRRKNAHFDMGAHLIGSCNRMGIFRKYLNDLGLSVDLVHLDPTDRFHFPDRTIDVAQDMDVYSGTLQTSFPEEADAITRFFKTMTRVATTFDHEETLDSFQNVSYQDFLDSFFHDGALKGILSAQHHYIGSIPKKASALSMCLMLTSYLRDGCYYIKGGSQHLPDTLAKRFVELGGEIRFGAKVNKVIIADNAAAGVTTDDGVGYAADYVVSNADARKTLLDAVGASNLPAEYVKRVESLKVGGSFFLTFLIVDLKAGDLEKVSGWHHSSYDLNDSDTRSFYVFVPTLYDGSLNADGLHTIELAMPFPYDYQDVTDWDQVKSSLEKELIARASGVIALLQDHIRYAFSATPRTIERFTGNTAGALCGWEMSVDQVQRYRLEPETPIKNLFLAGHWTRPGCGVVSVATSGWKVAKKIASFSKETVTR